MSNINHNFSELVELISTLRSENGCPWDRKQTHESLKRNLIEECYEVLESIENKDTQGIIEELGDVLLQIMFHAQIISEKEDFSITDVIDGLMDKMIRRHPHVFGDASADSAEQVEQNWEALKAEERRANNLHEIDVATALPALMRAGKIGKRAARMGFDWPESSGVLHKMQEELDEIRQAVAVGGGVQPLQAPAGRGAEPVRVRWPRPRRDRRPSRGRSRCRPPPAGGRPRVSSVRQVGLGDGTDCPQPMGDKTLVFDGLNFRATWHLTAPPSRHPPHATPRTTTSTT